MACKGHHRRSGLRSLEVFDNFKFSCRNNTNSLLESLFPKRASEHIKWNKTLLKENEAIDIIFFEFSQQSKMSRHDKNSIHKAKRAQQKEVEGNEGRNRE